MRLHLDDAELKDAIKYHLTTQENIDLNPELYEVTIDLTAGRGDKGHYADIVRTKRTDKVEDDDPFVSKADDSTEPDPDEAGIDFG